MKRLLINSHPALISEFSVELNVGVDINNIKENSSLKVWWHCRINPKHTWQSAVRNRAIEGYGCPYCSGRLVLEEESFGAKFPGLLKEWHPTKNEGLDPFSFSPKSDKYVWWLCAKIHEWRTQIQHRTSGTSGCKACNRISKSIAIRYPEIVKLWHPTKNKNISPNDIMPSSYTKIWWKCLKNPNHEWQLSATSMVKSQGLCRICFSKKQSRHPTLDIFSEELSKQWHPTKNGSLKPSDVYPGSGKKAWWICPNNPQHIWEAVICNRALKGRGCSKCSRAILSPERSLSNKYPIIARQWHPTKNKKLKPSDVSYASAKRVWWQCNKKSSHVWDATITSRTQKNRYKCPFCSGTKITLDNSLEAHFPRVASEWHPIKNGTLKPSEVTKAGRKKVWWQCKKNPDHEWQAQIKNRTILKSGCPKCARENAVFKFQAYLIDTALEHTDFFHVFIINIKNIGKLIKQEKVIEKKLKQAFFRMIYSASITSLETYLSDAFYQTTIKNPLLVEKLLKTSKDFSTRKFSISELLSWERKKDKLIAEYLLFDIVWHNLPKVQNLYKLVLNVSFPENISDVQRSIAIRHDIVHRNGRTKDGKTIRLDKNKLHSLFSTVEEFVKIVDKQMKQRETEPVTAPESQGGEASAG